MTEVFTASASGTLRKAFCTGTSVVVIPAGFVRQRSGGGADKGTAEGGTEVKGQAADM
jgi:hypothetical protein